LIRPFLPQRKITLLESRGRGLPATPATGGRLSSPQAMG
jgi:hypothetical protein